MCFNRDQSKTDSRLATDRENDSAAVFSPPKWDQLHIITQWRRHVYIVKGGEWVKGKRHKEPYVSSGQLASLLASSGHNKMHLLRTTLADPTLASAATHRSRIVRGPLKTESKPPERFGKPKKILKCVNMHDYGLRTSLRRCSVSISPRSQHH